MMTDFPLERAKGRKWQSNVFKILKEKKKKRQSRTLYSVKYHSKTKNKDFFKSTKVERTYQNRPALKKCKGSPSGRRKCMPDGNVDLHKGTEVTRNEATQKYV